VFARPGLPPFDYMRATTADEVVRLLTEHRDRVRLMMGGTDLFVRMREGAIRPQIVVDVKHLPSIRDVLYDQQTGLTVGAAVTMNQAAGHPEVRAHYAVLAQAARSVASYQVRNRATVGGNLCNASPCADTAPATLVLEGRLVLHGPNGVRAVPVAGFFRGPGQTVMQRDELLTAVRLPIPPSGSAGEYLKLGRTQAGDLSLVGVAVFGFPDATAPSGFRFRIALGSVAPMPLRAWAAEELLASSPPEDRTFDAAAVMAMESSTPIDDVRGSSAYQKAMVRTLTLRALHKVWRQLCTA